MASYPNWANHDAQAQYVPPGAQTDSYLDHPSTPGTANHNLPYDPYAPPATPYRDEIQPSPQFGGDNRLSADYRTSAASSSNPALGLLGGSSGQVNAYPPYRDSPLTSQPSFKDETPGAYGAMPSVPGGYTEKGHAGAKKKKGGMFWALVVGAVLLVAVAVVVALYFTVIKDDKKGSSGSSGSGGSASGGGTKPSSGITTGGDGSTVTTESGATFTYTNTFGGFWVQDPANPWNNSARPNDWTPPLDQPWDWGKDKIYGVNLGGWFVLEPFISPALFQKYNGTGDEWTLSAAMRADTAGGGIEQLVQHYETFYTEEDIAQIAGAGLNWVRMPIPFWAIDVWNDEPYLAGGAWPYILKALSWCRKYGLRVNLDLHTVPGSQNGNNHSGRLGPINWLRGSMGLANAQRTLDYIRVLTEFVNQDEYRDLVPMFSIVNEAQMGDIGVDPLTGFYLQAHDMMRKITGVGKGPYISIHDGFQGTGPFGNFLPGADRLIMDTHPYFAFGGTQAEPFLTGTGLVAGGEWPAKACSAWAPDIATHHRRFGVTIAGEFSNGWNDCGLFLLGTANTAFRYPGDCKFWEDHTQWGQDAKDGLMNYAMASMDALENWFFWTWKLGNAQSGRIEIPLWSYKLGLDNGWMPTDPRTAAGMCAKLSAAPTQPWTGTFAPSQTGGGDGQIAATARAEYPWPPTTLNNLKIPFAQVPTYTPTATIAPLAGPTITDAKGKTSVLVNTATPGPKMAPVEGCTYPDPWTVTPMSSAVCTGTAQAALGGAAAAATPAPVTPARQRRR